MTWCWCWLGMLFYFDYYCVLGLLLTYVLCVVLAYFDWCSFVRCSYVLLIMNLCGCLC